MATCPLATCLLLEWTVLVEAEAAFFAAPVPAFVDVVDFLAVDVAGFLVVEAVAAVNFGAVDFFTVEWVVLVAVVFFAVSALAAGAKTAQTPSQALNDNAIRIRGIDSI